MSLTTNQSIVQNGFVDDEEAETNSPAKPKRRRFTAEYKSRIVDEYDSMTDHGRLSPELLN